MLFLKNKEMADMLKNQIAIILSIKENLMENTVGKGKGNG